MRNGYSYAQSVTVSVYSQANLEDEETVIFSAQVDTAVQDLASDFQAFTAFAEMKKGYRPIIDAKITAIVDRPDGYDALNLDLYDNGAGALFIHLFINFTILYIKICVHGAFY